MIYLAIKIGIVDTTFSRVNMGAIAIEEIEKNYLHAQIERRTVPGIKDLAVECKKLLDGGANVVMALGMVGGAPIDLQCAHEASLGVAMAKLMTNKHIIEVFVHENEAWSEKEFFEICENRIRKHVHNAIMLVKDPNELIKNAGSGIRQGKENEGTIAYEIGAGKKEEEIKLAVIVSRFNEEITDKMKESAIQEARARSINLKIIEVPGVFDIPLVLKKILMDKSIDGAAVLGAVVKGDTAHDEVITKITASAVSNLSLEFRKPITLGIIGHGASWEMAQDRAKSYAENAIRSAVYLVNLLRK